MYCLIVTYVLIATRQYLYAIKVMQYWRGHVDHVEFINNGKYRNKKNIKYIYLYMLEWNKDRQKEKKNLALLITLTFV